MKAISRPVDGFTNEVQVREHTLVADEPATAGGNDRGPTPQEMLAAALASCTAITVQMYAGRKGWELPGLEVGVDYQPGDKGACAHFDVTLRLPAELSDEQIQRLHTIAGKCPVHRTLTECTVTDHVETKDEPRD